MGLAVAYAVTLWRSLVQIRQVAIRPPRPMSSNLDAAMDIDTPTVASSSKVKEQKKKKKDKSKDKSSGTAVQSAIIAAPGHAKQYQPPQGSVLLTEFIESPEFDYDTLKNDEDLELWVIRVPENVCFKMYCDRQMLD